VNPSSSATTPTCRCPDNSAKRTARGRATCNLLPSPTQSHTGASIRATCLLLRHAGRGAQPAFGVAATLPTLVVVVHEVAAGRDRDARRATAVSRSHHRSVLPIHTPSVLRHAAGSGACLWAGQEEKIDSKAHSVAVALEG
jgi:hypothetical protein